MCVHLENRGTREHSVEECTAREEKTIHDLHRTRDITRAGRAQEAKDVGVEFLWSASPMPAFYAEGKELGLFHNFFRSLKCCGKKFVGRQVKLIA